jgi:hypothetical protein
MRLLSILACVASAGCGSLEQYDLDDGDIALEALGDDDGDDRGAGEDDEEDQDGDGFLRGEDCDDRDDRVHPDAAEDCGDGVDSDCDGIDCVGWEDDFESAGLRPAWISDAASGWGVRASGRRGTRGAKSGAILDSQTSLLGLDVNMDVRGEISFWHSGSTEASYDFLVFSIDGAEVGSWSGTWAWQQETFAVPRGPHTLLWTWRKDVSQSVGEDAVYVDDVLLLGGSP